MGSAPPPVLELTLALGPFVLWDAALFLLRRRGDRSPRRLAAVRRHFGARDVALGRAHASRHNRLFPAGRLLFYAFFVAALPAGGAARLESWLLALTGHWSAALPLFVLALLLSWGTLNLPLEACRELVVLRREGLSTTTARLWLADQLRGLLLGTVVAAALALPVMAVVRWLPQWWPVPAAGVVAAVSAFLAWISPWLIAPLFNRFEPLTDEILAREVRALFARAGLRARRVLVTDASRRSTALNATFTGVGNSRRVVLFDTLVEACDRGEVLSVVAHELGHWRHRHIVKLLVLQCVGALAGLWALQALLHAPQSARLLGLPRPDSLVLLALAPLVGIIAGRLAAPLGAAISRCFERQADRVALELTEDPAALIRVQQRLVRRARADLLQPRLVHAWYGSPPLPEARIRAAEAWAAGRSGPPDDVTT